MRNNNEIKIEVKCEEGICPICGGPLGFSGNANMIEEYLPWVCLDCDATGKEGFCHKDPAPSDGTEWKDYVEFDGHFDVCLKNGTPVKLVAPSAKAEGTNDNEAPTEEVVCPVCGGELHYTGETSEQKYGICQQWKCPRCGSIGWAKFEEETNHYFAGEHEDVHLADGSEWDGQIITGTIELAKNHACDMDDAMASLAVANICAFEENGLIFILHKSVNKAADILAANGFMIHAVAGNTDCIPAAESANNADWPSPEDIGPAVEAVNGWFIPVTWEMYGVVRIPFEKAATLAEAMKCAREDMDIALPMGHYVDGSFAPSFEDAQVEEIRALYNDNRPDPEVAV